MARLRDIKADFVRRLAGRYPAREAEWLFFSFLETEAQLSRTDFFKDPDRQIEARPLERIAGRLAWGEPWQYVAGETEACGLRLRVDRRVLIPRPETEELALHICAAKFRPRSVLDIGTGSGCLALGLKKCFPGTQVTGMDFRDDILELARRNAALNRLDVDFVRGDALGNRFPAGPWDLVVSNPPYVLPSERAEMDPKVLKYEPPEALFVPQDDPIVFYRRIMRFFAKESSPRGQLFFEINPRTRELLATEAAVQGLAFDFRKDAYGKWRFMQLWKNA